MCSARAELSRSCRDREIIVAEDGSNATLTARSNVADKKHMEVLRELNPGSNKYEKVCDGVSFDSDQCTAVSGTDGEPAQLFIKNVTASDAGLYELRNAEKANRRCIVHSLIVTKGKHAMLRQ